MVTQGLYTPVVVVLVVSFIAALTDLWKYRVHNVLTIPLMASGLVYNGWMNGWEGLGLSLVGLFFGFCTLFLFFLMGGMGAGDVKLMAGVGAWLGLPLTLWVFLAAALISGVYALILIIAYGQMQRTWGRLKLIWYRLAAIGRHLGSEDQLEEELQQPEHRQRLIPFAAMMALGMAVLVILAMCFRTVP